MSLARIRSTTARYSDNSMLGSVVSGSRTWRCAIAAPARAAAMAESAICSGATGTAACFPGVGAEPVTAQVMMTFLTMALV